MKYAMIVLKKTQNYAILKENHQIILQYDNIFVFLPTIS